MHDTRHRLNRRGKTNVELPEYQNRNYNTMRPTICPEEEVAGAGESRLKRQPNII